MFEVISFSLFLHCLQILLFVILWFFLLWGLFHLVSQFIVNSFQSYFFANAVSSTVVGTFFFRIIYLVQDSYEDYEAEKHCSWIRYVIFSCTVPSTFSWLWKLDPIYVTADLLGGTLIKFFSMFGRTIGAFFSGLFSELPWLLYVPATIVCSFVIIFSIFALHGYELQVLSLFRMSRNTTAVTSEVHSSAQNSIKKFDDSYFTDLRSIPIVHESYQKKNK